MPVPTLISDLSQTANSNSPSGTESPITTDNYLRAHAAFIALTNAALGTGTAAGFTQAGTGANTRTVQAKLRDVVSVADFGVVGDGVTDDTAAFQVAADSGYPLFIPGHFNCLFSDYTGINCPTGFKLYGPGKITVPTAIGNTFKVIDIGNAYVTNNTDRSDIVIDGVTFYSAADQEFSTFIYLENGGGDLTDVTIKNCKFIYAPSAVTGGDRWAISFGGEFGDLRARIYIDNNELYGPMQLTANGQNANYQDIAITNNKVVGGRNACIALSRLSTTSDQNTYDRITIKGNHLYTDRGIGIFFGADSSTGSTAPMTWRDIDVADNTIMMDAAGGVTSQFGVFFRAPEGAASIVQRVSIRNNKIRVNASSPVGIGTNISREGTSTPPTTYEYTITENTIYGGGIDVRGGVLVRVGNNIAPDERTFMRENVIAELFENELNGVVLDGSATVYSERNRIVPRSTGQRCFYVSSATGKTNTLESVGDILDYRGTSGTGATAYRIEGVGTAVVRVIDPLDRYESWSSGFFQLLNSQVVNEYRPLKPVLNLNSTAVGNITTGEDNLMTYAMPAGLLNVAGRGIRINAWGTYANNVNAKTLKLHLGSAVIFTQSLTTSQAGEWRISAVIISTSTGSDAQDYFVEFDQDGTTQIRNMSVGTASQDEELEITIKCTGEGSNSNDVVQEGMLIETLN